jgi:hypothetical protein
LNGKPLTRATITCFQLGDVRKLFRYRASLRGVPTTTTEMDDALWLLPETGVLVSPFQAEDRPAAGWMLQ